MSNGFKYVCGIMDYLRENKKYEDLYNLIEGLCLGGMLNPSGKNRVGVTFLLPTDAGFIKKIEKLAYSDKLEDVEEASNLLRHCIINHLLKTSQDWEENKSNIPNAHRMKVDVKKIDKDTITFANGSTATLDKEFKVRRKDTRDENGKHVKEERAAIWLLSGEPPKGDKPAEMVLKSEFKKKEFKKGSADEERNKNTREYYREKLQNKIHKQCHYYASKNEDIDKNCAAVCVELFKYWCMEVKKYEKFAEFDEIFTGCPDFDLVVIYSCSIFPAELLVEFCAWKAGVSAVNVKRLFHRNYNYSKKKAKETHPSRNFSTILDEVNALRVDVQDATARNKIKAVKDAYAKLPQAAFHENFRQYLAQSPDFKLTLDVLNHLICCEIYNIKCGYPAKAYYNAMSNLYILLTAKADVKEILNQSIIMNENKLQNTIQPKEHVRVIEDFVTSTSFMHFHILSKEDLAEMKAKIAVTMNKEFSGILHTVISGVLDYAYTDADKDPQNPTAASVRPPFFRAEARAVAFELDSI